MKNSVKFWGIAVFIFMQLMSPSTCTDRMFVAEASNATILMAEAIEYSFVNATFTKIPLSGLLFPIGVEFDHRTELLYWTDAVLHTVNRAALDGSSQEVIAQLQNIPGDYKYPQGIALNLDDDKVYWTDGYRDVIECANLDGTNRLDLLTTGFNAFPVGIVYSSFRRKIYWTDRGQHPKLEMANPDGTERVTLIDGYIDSNFTHPTGLTLDASEQRLYWTDTTVDIIENLNLDNMNRFVNFWITNPSTDIHPYGVARYFEDIYFSDQLYDDVYAIDFPDGNIILVKDGLPTPAEIHIDADTTCPQSNLCAATGKCIITRRQPNDGFVCVCDAGYTGTHCEIDIDDCYPNPCMNRGICTDGPDSFTCTCARGYTGTTCSSGLVNISFFSICPTSP